jgi:hypothetical protein
MQIIFSFNFVYAYGMLCICSSINFETLTRKWGGIGQRRFIRSNQNDFRMKIFIGFQTLTYVVFTVWLLYVWIKGSDFGSQPACNNLVKYVLFFANVRATATWLRVLFIMNLVMTACSLSFRFGAILSEHMAQLRKEIHKLTHKLTKRTKVWHVVAHTEPQESREPEEREEQRSADDGPLPKYQRYVTLSLV